MKLGDNLRNLIEQYGITQRELAQALDITPAALGNYIRNIREPDYSTLIRISDYFHVSTDFLLDHSSIKTHLTHDEELLLSIFSSLSPDQKELYLEQGKLFIKHNHKKQLSTLNAPSPDNCVVG